MEQYTYFFLDTIWPFLRETAVLWVPAISLILTWDWWVEYVNKAYLAKLKWVLLEIKIPREVHKTPQAMELVLNALYQMGGVGNPKAKFWDGKLLAWHSLEIVSIEGSVYFFIRLEQRFKDMIEAQIYAQYPQAEVQEVDDYTKYVPPYHPDNGWTYKGCQMSLNSKKGDWLPIKTYVDYGLDAKGLMLDQEQRIDPITPLIEFLGSLRKGEQFWFQIIIRGGSGRFGLDEDGKTQDWQKNGRIAIDKILNEYASTEIKEKDPDDPEKLKVIKKVGGYKNLPPHLKEQVDSAERNLTKYGFDFGMRALYIAEPGKGTGMRMPAEFTNAMKQFNASNLNNFAMEKFTDDFDYPWQDWNDMRKIARRKKLFKMYVNRAWFYWPAGNESIKTLTTEELATVFHFPGSVSTTPTFERIEARKAEPPANLPV